MISVVIPLYNKAGQIGETLRSVLNQSFGHFEVVIVDDGSTDGSAAMAEGVEDPRIRLIRQSNQGVAAARNRGIEESRCELIAFLDADDLWQPDYLQTQYELSLKYPQCSVFACNYEFADSEGGVYPTIIKRLPFDTEEGILDNYFEVASVSHPPLWTSAVMVRKAAIRKIGCFPAGVKSGEDLLTWARLACANEIAYSRKITARFLEDSSHKVDHHVSRPHDEGDYVGESLCALWRAEKSALRKSRIRTYVALWYKMRLSVCVRMGQRRNSTKYAVKSLRFRFGSIKVWMMWGMVWLPPGFRRWLIGKYARS